jgi:hypothetical protein
MRLGAHMRQGGREEGDREREREREVTVHWNVSKLS